MRRIVVLSLALITLPRQLYAADRGRDAPPHPLILVHYMPWFQSKATSGKWGWHWTMDHFDPDQIDAEGKRSIAAHQYPLIGPYDSADPDVLEYHMLLMKVAGIDGVIADWYGCEDVNDYAMIHERTRKLFEECRKHSFKFCICYEERILKAMMDSKRIAPDQIEKHAQIHLQYCAEHWFRDGQYLTWQGRPVLLSYGPEALRPAQWNSILSVVEPLPALFLLHQLHPPATGSFAWPPMWKCANGVLDQSGLTDYLGSFSRQQGAKIAGAFPGFHDIYEEAGIEKSHGYLSEQRGKTFAETLKRAVAADFIQIITWNDFGEGTNIEPSREYEYRYLEELQTLRAQRLGDELLYRAADLRLPLRIYQLRKSEPTASASITPTLDRAVDLLFDGEINQAVDLIDNVTNRGATQSISRY